jgi:hypothetical protein
MSLAATGSAHAWIKNFNGTRDQVRTACANVGGDLTEGIDSAGIGVTSCINKNNNTGVVCGDDGKCTGTGPRTSTGFMPKAPLATGSLATGTSTPVAPTPPPAAAGAPLPPPVHSPGTIL